MKRIIISVGKDLDFASFMSLMAKIEHYLDEQKYDFEGYISITTNDNIPEASRSFLQNFIDYAESSLGMFFNVLFCKKNIPVSTLEIVKSCERFFFLEGALITKSNESLISKGCYDINRKIPNVCDVKSVNALKFRGLDDSVFKDVRQLYFGLSQEDMAEDVEFGNDRGNDFEVFGDIDAFKRLGLSRLTEKKSGQERSMNAA